MNRHLSARRISMWMAGDRTAEEERHIRECPRCAAELAHWEAILARFRGSVRDWSARQGGLQAGGACVARPARSRFHLPPARWAVAALALLVAVMVPVYRSARRPHTGSRMARADAALLEQVDARVSQAVPQPMEPLLRLVSWDSSSASDASGSRTSAKGKEDYETTQPR